MELRRQSKRENFVFMFIGTNRTGKTSTAVQFAENWKINNPEKRIICFDPQNKFNGIATDFILDDIDAENFMQEKNCLFIFDDYRLLHESDRREKSTRWLFYQMNHRAQNNNDFIIITHAPNLVLTYLTYYITHYFIFRTNTTDNFSNKIPSYTIMRDAVHEINAEVQKTGDGGKYPDFKHILIDVKLEKKENVNF